MSVRILAVLLLLGAAPLAAQEAAPPASAQGDHLALDVADEDASAEFYKAAFGLKEVPAPFPNRRWLDLGNGLVLHLLGDRKAPLATTKSNHLALRVRSLDPLIAYLKSKGMAWEDWAGKPREITMRPDGIHQIFLRDIDGHWIEVNDMPRVD